MPSAQLRTSLSRLAALLVALPLLAGAWSPSAEAACPKDVTAMLGVYEVTTVVNGAGTQSGVGLNGYYLMRVTADACVPTANLTKLGFTNVRFTPERVQSGDLPMRIYHIPDNAGGRTPAGVASGTLRSASGSALELELTFVRGGGFWRHRGASWRDDPRYGALTARKIAGGEAFAQDPRPFACETWKVGRSGAAFGCGSVLVVSAALDKALFVYDPKRASGDTIGADFRAFLGDGEAGASSWLDFCADPVGDRDGAGAAHRVTLTGATATIAPAAEERQRECGEVVRGRAPAKRPGAAGPRAGRDLCVRAAENLVKIALVQAMTGIGPEIPEDVRRQAEDKARESMQPTKRAFIEGCVDQYPEDAIQCYANAADLIAWEACNRAFE